MTKQNTSSFLIHNGPQWTDINGDHIQAHSGGMFIENGTYYWYGTHMGEGPKGNLGEVGIVGYRSQDLMNWEPLGVMLPVSQDESHDLYRGLRMERPKVIKREDGKYVMWFHWVRSGCGHEVAQTGVAVADQIEGPYRYVGRFHPDGWMARDMTLFQDRDGSAYHVYAAGQADRWNNTLNISVLSNDLLKPSGTMIQAFPERFMEAPAIIYTQQHYWMICSGCSGWNPNRGRAAKAKSMLGPWFETGDPCVENDKEPTHLMFRSQPNHAFELIDQPGCFVLMADRWHPEDHSLSRPIWLPIFIREGRVVLEWFDSWGPEVFEH